MCIDMNNNKPAQKYQTWFIHILPTLNITIDEIYIYIYFWVGEDYQIMFSGRVGLVYKAQTNYVIYNGGVLET